jgi:hypothetical protein
MTVVLLGCRCQNVILLPSKGTTSFDKVFSKQELFKEQGLGQCGLMGPPGG